MTAGGPVDTRLTGTLVLAADRVLPLSDVDPISHGAIAIRDGVIVAVGPAEQVMRSHGTAHAMPGTTLLPGLVDAHDHLHGWRADPTPGSAGASERVLGRVAAAEASRHLSSGVTLVRVLGTPHREDLTLRDNGVPGDTWRLPALSCAGRAITGPTGPSSTARIVLDANEARHAVDEEVAHGADWIKVLVSRGIDAAAGTMRTPALAPGVVRAIVAQASSLGRRVAAHAHGESALQIAVDSGVASIEHGTGLTAALARAMADRRIALVPTLVTYRRLANRGDEIGLPAAWRAQAASILDAHSRTTRIALEHGVALAAGSDGFGDLVEELLALSDLGLAPYGALTACISGGADLVDPGSGQGKFAVGTRANVIAVIGDPRADLASLGQARPIVRDGHFLGDVPSLT